MARNELRKTPQNVEAEISVLGCGFLDRTALDIISRMDAKELDEYFKKYKSTICGRNPISIVLCLIEKFKSKNTSKKISFSCAGYAQSSKVTDMSDSSVSYAAGVNFIE